MKKARSGQVPPIPRSDGTRNRRALLAAAGRLFEHRSSVSMNDVAHEAGLTRATVYRHFPDRDALLGALVVELAAEIIPPLLARLQQADAGTAMDDIGGFVAATASRHQNLVNAIAPRLEQLLRNAVLDEPMETYLHRRRALGELQAPQSDAYLAAAVRALCLAAVSDPREPHLVAADLSQTLRRVIGATTSDAAQCP